MLASLILIGGSLGDRLGRKRGIGGVLMIPGSLSLISAAIDEKEKGKAIGIWSAATTVVTVGGPILGDCVGAGAADFRVFADSRTGLAALGVRGYNGGRACVAGRFYPDRKAKPKSYDAFGFICQPDLYRR